MINKHNINKILNKFSEDKTELTKVELSIAGDIEKALGAVLNDKTKLDTQFSVKKKEAQSVIAAVKAAKKVDARADGIIKNARKTLKDATSIVNKARTAAKELGVKPESIKGFKRLTSELPDVNSLWRELEDYRVVGVIRNLLR